MRLGGGPNWVSLAWLATHRAWDVIALPLRSMPYLREVDVPKRRGRYAWEVRTKHQLGVKLLRWFMESMRVLGVKTRVWLAVDGTYAMQPFCPCHPEHSEGFRREFTLDSSLRSG